MDKAPQVRLAVHRDRDYSSDEQATKFETRLADNKIIPLLTRDNDIEVYFISAAHLNHLNPTVAVSRIQEFIDQATDETRDQSIAAMVNLRTEEAFKIRQAGGPPPDHGAIAVKAASDYDKDPAAYRRGKLVIGRVAALLQKELGSNPRIYSPSEYLKHSEFSSAAASIWDAQC
jgi:hypothetical protein